MAAALAIPAARYLLVPPRPGRKEEWTEAGEVSQLSPGSPVELVFRRNRRDGWRVISEKNTVWVVRKSQTEVVAFAPQCPHLGCAFHWDETNRHFLCPCHTSAFSLDGAVLSGPSARGLDRYPAKVEQNRLLVGSEVIPGPRAAS